MKSTICSEEGCLEPILARGLCSKHYARYRARGTIQEYSLDAQRGKGYIQDGYIMIGRKFEHVIIAEKALGRPMPPGAQVHHVNGIRSDNTSPWNLVICEDYGYHKLLHQRAEALESCGDANFKKCQFCKVWDHPRNLYIAPTTIWHKYCVNLYHQSGNNIEEFRRRLQHREISR